MVRQKSHRRQKQIDVGPFLLFLGSLLFSFIIPGGPCQRQLATKSGVHLQVKNQTALPVAFVLLVIVGGGCDRKPEREATRTAETRAVSSLDSSKPLEGSKPAKALGFENAGLSQVLDLYAEVSGRSVIRGANLPEINVTFSNQTALDRVEVLRALDTVLAAQGIAMVVLGNHYVKAVLAKEAYLEPGPVLEAKSDQLPDSSSFVICIAKLKNVTTSKAVVALQPFARLPNSIVAINAGDGGKPSSGTALGNIPAMLGIKDYPILILRDYSSNVRRMLQVLEKMEEQ
jgi:hypothetical protein